MSVSLGAVRFTAVQEAAIRSWFGPLRNRVAVSEVRHVLDLPAMNHHEFLGPSCWLAGGSVLRWICGEHSDGGVTKGDFDFYFPSLDALNATAQAMVERGFRVRGYGSRPRNIREFLTRPVRNERDSGIWNDSGDLAPITAELRERLELGTLELISPEGEAIQLVALAFGATPLETIMRFDFSICQLALDDRYLSFGPSTLNDIIDNRFRAENVPWPLTTCRRMFRYIRRGFWPRFGSAVRILALACGRAARHGIHGLRRKGEHLTR